MIRRDTGSRGHFCCCNKLITPRSESLGISARKTALEPIMMQPDKTSPAQQHRTRTDSTIIGGCVFILDDTILVIFAAT